MMFISSCSTPRGASAKHLKTPAISSHYLHNSISALAWLRMCLLPLPPSLPPFHLFQISRTSWMTDTSSILKIDGTNKAQRYRDLIWSFFKTSIWGRSWDMEMWGKCKEMQSDLHFFSHSRKYVFMKHISKNLGAASPLSRSFLHTQHSPYYAHCVCLLSSEYLAPKSIDVQVYLM